MRTTYKDVRNDVLGFATMALTVFSTMIWAGNTCYYGLSEDDACFLLCIQGAICCTLVIIALFSTHFVAIKINRYATKRFIVKIVRKINEAYDYVSESAASNED